LAAGFAAAHQNPGFSAAPSAEAFTYGGAAEYGGPGSWTPTETGESGFPMPSYGSSPALIGRPPITRSSVPTVPCPNCGELATENALSCARCNYRFYAPCPNCGEYIDTGTPSSDGKDVCPRYAQPVDKLALGREGARGGPRTMNPREAALAGHRQQQTQQVVAAQVAAEPAKRRSSSGTTLLFLLLLLLILYVLVANMNPALPGYTLIHPLIGQFVPHVLPTPTP